MHLHEHWPFRMLQDISGTGLQVVWLAVAHQAEGRASRGGAASSCRGATIPAAADLVNEAYKIIVEI